MPIVDSGILVAVSLECDINKPAETRPAFLCKHMPSRTQRNYVKAVREYAAGMDSGKSPLDHMPGLLQALAFTVVEGRNLPPAPSVEDLLQDTLTEQEVFELALKILQALAASEGEYHKAASIAAPA